MSEGNQPKPPSEIRREAAQLLALAISLVVLLTPLRASLSYSLVAVVAQSQAADPVHNNQRLAKVDYAGVKADLDKRLATLRTIYNSTDWPADTPAEIGKLLTRDPHTCQAYIRAALRYEPYSGVLRGGQGALAAGGGNSADLSLLLRDMLRGSSPPLPMRFAVAELKPEQATALVDAAIGAPPPRPVLAAAAVGKSGKSEPTPPASETQLFESHAANVRQLLADARADMEHVRTLLGAEAIKPGNRDEAIAAARQHVWLQIYHDGRWESFDPVADLPLPTAAVQILEELPSEWQHVIGVKVEVERLTDSSVDRESLIEHIWAAAALEGRAIEVVIVPSEFSIDRLLDPKAAAGRILEQAKSFKTFQVSLGVTGEELRSGRSFDLEGKTSAAPSPGPLGIGSVDPFRRLPSAVPKPKSDLAGLWLTITIRSPGAKAQKLERPLLDRIGPAARAQNRLTLSSAWLDPQPVRLALIQQHQVLLPTGPIGLGRLAREALTSVVEQPSVLEHALALKYGEYKGTLNDALKGLRLPEHPADLIAVSDGALALTGAMMAGHGISYLSAPNLYLRSEAIALGKGNEVLHRIGIDIAVNRLQVLGDSRAGAETRLMHGLLVSEMEGRSLQADKPTPTAIWAAHLLRVAGEQQIELRVLRKAADLDGIEADADAKALMAAQLAAGDVLLVPAKPVAMSQGPRTAWWRLDREGHALAVGADGRGQAMTEGMMVLTDISIPMVKRSMEFVACFNKAIAGGGSMKEAGAQCLSQEIVDIVKDSLDQAIETFVKDPLNTGLDEARAGMLGEEYEELYQKAKKAYELYKKGRETLEDPLGQVPGVKEGRDAAKAGAEIGSIFGFRLYLLLVMGRDIAGHASKL